MKKNRGSCEGLPRLFLLRSLMCSTKKENRLLGAVFLDDL